MTLYDIIGLNGTTYAGIPSFMGPLYGIEFAGLTNYNSLYFYIRNKETNIWVPYFGSISIVCDERYYIIECSMLKH